jgi:hypothetical protein
VAKALAIAVILVSMSAVPFGIGAIYGAMWLKLFLIAGVLSSGILLWIAHTRGLTLPSRGWPPLWPIFHRDDDPWWFYLCVSSGWLGLVLYLGVLIGVLASEWGITSLRFTF